MSLSRLALRLAVVNALAADPVIAALCDDRIDDSRMSEIGPAEPLPVIIVTTEEDSGPAYAANNGGPPFHHTCKLVLEIMVRAIELGEDDEPAAVLVAATTRETEAILDLLEDRAVEIIGVGESAEAALIRTVTRRLTMIQSQRFATDDTSARLAQRLVTLSVELKGEDVDGVGAPTGPYAVLPDPLRTIAESLPANSSAKATVDQIAARLTVPTPVPLEGVDVVIAPQTLDAASPPSRADDIERGATLSAAADFPAWSA